MVYWVETERKAKRCYNKKDNGNFRKAFTTFAQ